MKNIFKTETGKIDKKFIVICIIMLSFSFFLPFTFNIDYNAGNSNEPTIKEGQHTVVMKHFYDINVGDFIVFSKYYVHDGENINKRVVAKGGDHVTTNNGKILINGKEDKFFPNTYCRHNIDIIVPEGSYFVLGDNRGDSFDSRNFGVVNEDEIIGKVIWY